jgi:hypothetical protein
MITNKLMVPNGASFSIVQWIQEHNNSSIKLVKICIKKTS